MAEASNKRPQNLRKKEILSSFYRVISVSGGQKVASSNLAIPTIFFAYKHKHPLESTFFAFSANLVTSYSCEENIPLLSSKRRFQGTRGFPSVIRGSNSPSRVRTGLLTIAAQQRESRSDSRAWGGGAERVARVLQKRPKQPAPPQTAVRPRADWPAISPFDGYKQGLYFQCSPHGNHSEVAPERLAINRQTCRWGI